MNTQLIYSILQDHENRIQENTNQIQENTEQIQELKQELQNLKQAYQTNEKELTFKIQEIARLKFKLDQMHNQFKDIKL